MKNEKPIDERSDKPVEEDRTTYFIEGVEVTREQLMKTLRLKKRNSLEEEKPRRIFPVDVLGP
jgi:hypothetical protein